MSVVVTKNEKETKDLARNLANDILSDSEKRSSALVLALEGVLGAGKTTFTQGFAEGLNIKEPVTSPTFLILKEYELEEGYVFKRFYHVDCYRLKDENDTKDIGLDEILKNPENLILIEWAQKIKKSLPKDIRNIKFFYISENKRKISIS